MAEPIDYDDFLDAIRDTMDNILEKVSGVSGIENMDISSLAMPTLTMTHNDTVVEKDGIPGVTFIRNVYPDIIDRHVVVIDIHFIPRDKFRMDTTDILLINTKKDG